MRNIYLLFIAVGVLFLGACNTQDPVKYNNDLITEQLKIVEKIDDLKKAIDNFNVLSPEVAIDQMNIAYDNAVFQIDSGLLKVKNMENFKDDATLKNGATELFTNYKSVVENEYKNVIELYKIPDNMFTKEDSEKLEKLLQEGNEKLSLAYVDFQKVQQTFATDNKLKLE